MKDTVIGSPPCAMLLCMVIDQLDNLLVMLKNTYLDLGTILGYRISLIRTRTQIQRALEYKTTKAS